MLELIHQFGYLGVFITIFSEIGLMLFPLPGDTLMFTVGILSENGMFSYIYMIFLSILASTIGGHVGYFIGQKIDRETLLDNRIYKIKDHHLHKTEKFFEKYGVYAILFSRFIPIVRNFISQLMGIISYNKHKFFWANLGASILWPSVLISLGYFFGKMFPNLIVYSEYFMIGVLVVLTFPLIYEIWKHKKS